MPDADAFLRTILDAPDDDGPRLVYADWLEEQGDCDRAELIRTQIRLSLLEKQPCSVAAGTWVKATSSSGKPLTEWPKSPPVRCCMPWDDLLGVGLCRKCAAIDRVQLRERELLCANVGNWLGPLEATLGRPTVALIDDASVPVAELVSVRYRRGFIDAVHASAADLIKHAAFILAANPISEFRSTDTWYTIEIHRSPGGWIAVAGDGGGPAWFWRTREAMLAPDGLPRVMRDWFRVPDEPRRGMVVTVTREDIVADRARLVYRDVLEGMVRDVAARLCVPERVLGTPAETIPVEERERIAAAVTAIPRGSLITLPPSVEVAQPLPLRAMSHVLVVPWGDHAAAIRRLAADPPPCPLCDGDAVGEVGEATPMGGNLARVTVSWRCPACHPEGPTPPPRTPPSSATQPASGSGRSR